MPGTLTLTGMSAGLVSGMSETGPVTMTGNALVGQITDAALTTGDNTFPVPSGASAVAIFLGIAPAATVTVRTNLNSGDAGLPVSPYSGLGFSVFPLPVGSTSVVLHASAPVAGAELKFI